MRRIPKQGQTWLRLEECKGFTGFTTWGLKCMVEGCSKTGYPLEGVKECKGYMAKDEGVGLDG